jgi:hypothetical protein
MTVCAEEDTLVEFSFGAISEAVEAGLDEVTRLFTFHFGVFINVMELESSLVDDSIAVMARAAFVGNGKRFVLSSKLLAHCASALIAVWLVVVLFLSASTSEC